MADDTTIPTVRSDQEWRERLTPDQYKILREAGTERPFTGEYVDVFDDGTYRCAGCEAELFLSDTKYDHGCGWPSFTQPAQEGSVLYKEDRAFGMKRVEVLCASCGGHLGHVFDDGPPAAGGNRFCINSGAVSLDRA